MLHRTRALTLCGPGGIGKTRLALRLLATAAEFPDGVWFVELADLRQRDLQQADLVVSRIAGVIGITEEAGRPLLETLGDALRPRRMLLALDNCEHLLDGMPVLLERLLAGSPRLSVLVTSRARLLVPFEWVFGVPGLSIAAGDGSPGDAVELFLTRAAAAGSALTEADAARVAAICRGLDGVALAIELTAARVPSLGLDGIVCLMPEPSAGAFDGQ